MADRQIKIAKDYFSEKNNPGFWSGQISLEQLRSRMGQALPCPACGRVHGILTRMIEQAPDMALKIGGYLRELGLSGRCTVVMDTNTRKAAGEALLEGLADFRPRAVVFDRPDLHADEPALGLLLAELSDKPDFLVSCGSGTLTDITRYTSYMTGIPFVAFATAPSVDGFASSSTPLLVRGFKKTYLGVAPMGIFYDPAVLAAAPRKMTAAGFGDVLAKVIALIDWRLAYVAEDEDYCPLIASLVERAVEDCLKLAADLADQPDLAKKGAACACLMETLSMTGIAMQMMGTSRPASGGEHHISHLLEMRDIQQHRLGSLHGDKVGIGTLICLEMYRRLFGGGSLPKQRATLPADRWESEIRRVYGPLSSQALAINESQPPQGEVWERQKEQLEKAMQQFGYAVVRSFEVLLPAARDKILAIGGPVRPDQLGYTRQDAYDAIAYGKEVRPKFTILRLAERFGWLYDLAEEFADGSWLGSCLNRRN